MYDRRKGERVKGAGGRQGTRPVRGGEEPERTCSAAWPPLPRAPGSLTPVTPGHPGRVRCQSHLGESGIGTVSSQLETPKNQDSCGRLPSRAFSPEICARNKCLFAKHLFPENSLILSLSLFLSVTFCVFIKAIFHPCYSVALFQSQIYFLKSIWHSEVLHVAW